MKNTYSSSIISPGANSKLWAKLGLVVAIVGNMFLHSNAQAQETAAEFMDEAVTRTHNALTGASGSAGCLPECSSSLNNMSASAVCHPWQEISGGKCRDLQCPPPSELRSYTRGGGVHYGCLVVNGNSSTELNPCSLYQVASSVGCTHVVCPSGHTLMENGQCLQRSGISCDEIERNKRELCEKILPEPCPAGYTDRRTRICKVTRSSSRSATGYDCISPDGFYTTMQVTDSLDGVCVPPPLPPPFCPAYNNIQETDGQFSNLSCQAGTCACPAGSTCFEGTFVTACLVTTTRPSSTTTTTPTTTTLPQSWSTSTTTPTTTTLPQSWSTSTTTPTTTVPLSSTSSALPH